LFEVDIKDRSCAYPNAKPFNSYTLNLLQNPKLNFTVNFSDPIVQRTLFQNAVRRFIWKSLESLINMNAVFLVFC
jgi:hypothetical protein